MTQLEALEAVLFDLDGLLVDTEPLWVRSADEVLRRRGATWDRSLRQHVMGRHPREVARFMIDHYGLDCDAESLMEERLELQRELYQRHGVELLGGAQELVDGLLAARVPMAVASGSPTHLVRSCLEAVGLVTRFGAVVGADRVGRGKPAPDVFLAAAAELGASAAGCVVLEDANNGVQAALAAHMSCVKVARDGELAGAHLLVESLHDVSPADLQRLVTHGRQHR